MNAFRQLLRAAGSNPPIGTWIRSASPIVAEAMGHAGFDWGVVDMEHAPLDMMDVVHLLQALGNTKMVPRGARALERRGDGQARARRRRDHGAVPLRAERRRGARARWPPRATRPQGQRGMSGMSRASKFGTVPNYLKTADAGMGVIVQLETPQALAQLEAIAAVDGVDAMFIGPGRPVGQHGPRRPVHAPGGDAGRWPMPRGAARRWASRSARSAARPTW